jgi:hypothetical protein
MRRHLSALLLAMLSSTHAAEQPVPVVKEPYHKVVFENQYVRIIDVQIPPAVTTQYHIHDVPSVIVYLTKSTNASQSWGEANTTPRQTTPGDARYAPYDSSPLTHRVTNTGNNLFHVYDIELLRPASEAAFAAPPVGARVQWDQSRLRAMSLTVEPGTSTTIAASADAHLVVAIRDTVGVQPKTGGGRDVKPGEYSFHAANTALLVRNGGKASAECVLLELK